MDQPGEEPEPTDDPKAEGGSEPSGEQGPDGEVVVGGGENKGPVSGNDTKSAGPVMGRLGLFQLLAVAGLCLIWS